MNQGGTVEASRFTATRDRIRDRGKSLVATAVVAVALGASGCSGTSGTAADGAGGPAEQAVPTAAVSTDVEELERIAALDPEALDAEVAASSALAWDDLLVLSGLTEKLGSDEAARRSEELSAALVATFEPLDSAPTGLVVPEEEGADADADGAASFAPRRLQGTSTDAAVHAEPEAAGTMYGLGVGLLEVKLVTADLVDNTSTGLAGTANDPDKRWTVKSERGKVSYSSNHSESDKGMTFEVHNTLEVQPCPDADGAFAISGRIDVAVSMGDGSGGRAEIDFKVDGQIDDDARIVAKDHDVRFQMGDHAGGSGAFVDATLGYSVTGAPPEQVYSPGRFDVARRSSAVTDAQIDRYTELAKLFGYTFANLTLDAARNGWESGRCVEIATSSEPSGSTLKPSTTVSIVAMPKSRIDGTSAGGTVTATLAGAASVDPAGTKVPADATFTYVAPEEVGAKGSVALEARSRRGVAKKTLEFSTTRTRYTATGGGNGLEVTGTVEDLAAPFELSGTFPGATVSFAYAPTSATAGAVTYGGGGGGATVTGAGTYTIEGPEGGSLVLTQTTEGCADVGACRTNTAVITLTPID